MTTEEMRSALAGVYKDKFAVGYMASIIAKEIDGKLQRATDEKIKTIFTRLILTWKLEPLRRLK